MVVYLMSYWDGSILIVSDRDGSISHPELLRW